MANHSGSMSEACMSFESRTEQHYLIQLHRAEAVYKLTSEFIVMRGREAISDTRSQKK